MALVVFGAIECPPPTLRTLPLGFSAVLSESGGAQKRICSPPPSAAKELTINKMSLSPNLAEILSLAQNSRQRPICAMRTVMYGLYEQGKYPTGTALTFRCFMPLLNSMISWVPRVLRSIASRKGSSNRTLAAPWKTKETSRWSRALLSSERPIPFADMSPAIATTFFSASGRSFLSKSNNCNKAMRSFSN